MEQRTELITGASDGIGKATAAGLLRDGWRVVVVGRGPTRSFSTPMPSSATAPSPPRGSSPTWPSATSAEHCSSGRSRTSCRA
jgi:nucleoside-diphosphate-sugar epimerase